MGVSQNTFKMSDVGPDTDLTTLTVVQLKQALKTKGLKATGARQDLIDRLQLAMETQDDSNLIEDANVLLGEDDDDDVDETAAAIPKKKVTPQKASIKPKPIEFTKVASPASKDETNTEKKDTETKPSTDKPKTDAERAAARAARFGGSVSSEVEAKKQARAARFGIKSGKIGDTPEVDLETLRKRAERFGQSSSTAMKNAELDEKIKKRQERFGIVQPDPKKIKKSDSSEVLTKIELNKSLKEDKPMDEKMLKRAERFGAVKASA